MKVRARPLAGFAVALAVAIAGLTGIAPASAAPSAQSAQSVATSEAVARILSDTNVLRMAGGLAPLVSNPALDAVAQNWSAQQAANGAMSHNPDYSRQIPGGWTNAGENVARGYTYDSVVEGWHQSAGHYANIMGTYTDIGIGYYDAGNGKRYFTQVFARYPATVVAAGPPTSSPDGSVEIYRFYSPRNGTHFYTASLAERNSIIATYPRSVWTYEGVAYRAFTTQVDGTIPLYRFWSPLLRSHFFTSSSDERDRIVATYAPSVWTSEGVAFYVYPADSGTAGTVTVSRFWSPLAGRHFYTASATEAASIRANYPASVWTFEGDTFRVPAS